MDNQFNISNEEIWDYLSGKAPDELRLKIEQEIASNPEFKSEIESTRTLWEQLNQISEHKDLKQSFNQFHEKNFAEPKKKKSKKIWLYTLSAVASIALIFTISNLLFVNETSNADFSPYREMKQEVKSSKASAEEIYDIHHVTATAFAINDSILITSYHAIANKDSITLSQSAGQHWLKAGVVSWNDTLDIALLKINPDSVKTKLNPIYLESKTPLLGQKIFGIGFPKNDLVYGEGVISSLSGFDNDTNSIQISMPVNPGNSGTPIFNYNGALIGMVLGKNIEQEGTAYALKNKYLIDFLKKNNIKLTRKNKLKYKKHLDQIERLKASVFLIKC